MRVQASLAQACNEVLLVNSVNMEALRGLAAVYRGAGDEAGASMLQRQVDEVQIAADAAAASASASATTDLAASTLQLLESRRSPRRFAVVVLSSPSPESST